MNDLNNEIIIFKSIREIIDFSEYLGEYNILQFNKAVEDDRGNILVQKDSLLSRGLIDKLKVRKNDELPENYQFKYTKKLLQRCVAKIMEKLFQCLQPTSYHIAPSLLNNTSVNYLNIAKSVLNNPSIFSLFNKLSFDDEPLLPHLGEVALLATSISEHLFKNMNLKEKEFHRILVLSMTSGLLHDISLSENDDFLLNDIELAKASGHEKSSVTFIKNNFVDVDQSVIIAISDHHREKPFYTGSEILKLSSDEIIKESLNFSEFFFSQIRSAYKYRVKNQLNALQAIFFNIGQALGTGFFHQYIYKIMMKMQKDFESIMVFGKNVGILEKQCLYEISAVAYPSPKCTQILCRDKILECKYIQQNYPIEIVKTNRYLGTQWKLVHPGTYPKCKLSENLPEPPDVL